MKKIMTTAALLLGAALGFGGRASAQTVEAYPSYIEVSGYAEREVAPDVFYLRVDINESDSKGKKTLDEQQRNLVTALKSLKVDTEKQLTRLSLSSSFTKKSNMASASYQVKLDSSDAVSKVWQKLDSMGFSRVTFLRAEYSRMNQLKEEVRKEAVLNARNQASAMAEAVGQKIGKCFYMYLGNVGSSASYAQPRLTKSVLAVNSDGAVAEDENIEFDKIKTTVNVQTKFVLE